MMGLKKVSDVPLLIIIYLKLIASKLIQETHKNNQQQINCRTLLYLFTRNTFIGFTATPREFCLFRFSWDPKATIVKNGRITTEPDLFPKHFINIHASSDYIYR
jgi:hypothetical protein